MSDIKHNQYHGKILVSACLMGQAVRYDGQTKTFTHCQLHQWQQQDRLIIVCPEVAGGLSVPRKPAEILHDRVITTTGKDVTDAFQLGAQKALQLCQQHNIQYALLKSHSPSCGNQEIYDGYFRKRSIQGMGITASLLQQHNIQVFNEHQIEELASCINKQHALKVHLGHCNAKIL